MEAAQKQADTLKNQLQGKDVEQMIPKVQREGQEVKDVSASHCCTKELISKYRLIS